MKFVPRVADASNYMTPAAFKTPRDFIVSDGVRRVTVEAATAEGAIKCMAIGWQIEESKLTARRPYEIDKSEKTKPASAQSVEQEGAESMRKHKTKSNGKPNRKEKDLLFGHSVTAVVRRLGKAGVTNAKAVVEVLDDLQHGTTVACVRTFLYAGKKGERGEPAEITKAQLDQLTGAVEKKIEAAAKEKK